MEGELECEDAYDHALSSPVGGGWLENRSVWDMAAASRHTAMFR
ncbi:hypothetical protein DVDV_3222 [Desulfovibrio sp. DV]|nr:hypothetical protein DVDV_3222 [Desulfovibrio sp. DV]